ncbi:hypothetical protein Bbelb_142720 [Branchiostoma belcheri]|nr:hypothetical protein Bbelb_142720 [Branchiostoma belcheri]
MPCLGFQRCKAGPCPLVGDNCCIRPRAARPASGIPGVQQSSPADPRIPTAPGRHGNPSGRHGNADEETMSPDRQLAGPRWLMGRAPDAGRAVAAGGRASGPPCRAAPHTGLRPPPQSHALLLYLTTTHDQNSSAMIWTSSGIITKLRGSYPDDGGCLGSFSPAALSGTPLMADQRNFAVSTPVNQPSIQGLTQTTEV